MGCEINCSRCDPRVRANCGTGRLNAYNEQGPRMDVTVYESRPVRSPQPVIPEMPVVNAIFNPKEPRPVDLLLDVSAGRGVITPWDWLMRLIGKR